MWWAHNEISWNIMKLLRQKGVGWPSPQITFQCQMIWNKSLMPNCPNNIYPDRKKSPRNKTLFFYMKTFFILIHTSSICFKFIPISNTHISTLWLTEWKQKKFHFLFSLFRSLLSASSHIFLSHKIDVQHAVVKWSVLLSSSWIEKLKIYFY